MNKSEHTIPLTGGLTTKVSAEDFGELSKYRWSASHKNSGVPRAVRRRRKSDGCGPAQVYMHRQIMGDPTGQVVDHINRDPLDNRRENLRLCTAAENVRNRSPASGRTFKGVFRNGRRWTARIRINGVLENLGTYDTAKEAATHYDKRAAEAWGEYACLNGSAS
ncbi:HNH endonuclease [Brevundimonas diminuta]|uniref:HNH endonuclease n=1 Tax=Brevundimonas diminuta TaxID=293 RepID=UPI000B36266D|nr:HNH endonuclease [Brevundimonas diminuta]